MRICRNSTNKRRSVRYRRERTHEDLYIGRKTFAIFGTGADIYFPRSNANLFGDIMECGALISEFPIGSQGEQSGIFQRNRIVAALSSKLVVVEAPLKSGAMITAGIAAELGREVWAVPGRIDEGMAYGSNKLIFEGAYPLIDLKDFLRQVHLLLFK